MIQKNSIINNMQPLLIEILIDKKFQLSKKEAW